MTPYLEAQILGDVFNVMLMGACFGLAAWWKVRSTSRSLTPVHGSARPLKDLASELRWAVDNLEAFDRATAELDINSAPGGNADQTREALAQEVKARFELLVENAVFASRGKR